MIPIRFMKAAPTTYVLQYRDGRLRREGPGLAFFYYAPTSTIVSVPLSSADAPFMFNEMTADFQTVGVQGQLTYRVADPKKLSALLDLSVGPAGLYLSDDYQKIPERLVQATQTLVREQMQGMTLREALTSGTGLAAGVLAGLKASRGISELGLEILNLSVLAVRATPEMAKALEAEAREALNRRSDEAIYSRRNAAVEQERLIRENELRTEIAVEEKQREIREVRMATDIAIEEQRAQLMDQRVENERKEADSHAYTLKATLEPIREVDWRKLMMLATSGVDARSVIALAFQEMAANAQKIGELNVSPDLLRSLLAAPPAAPVVTGKGK